MPIMSDSVNGLDSSGENDLSFLMTDEERKSILPEKPHKYDTDDYYKRIFKMALNWYYYELERQGPNRVQMEMDVGMYDNKQFTEDDRDKLVQRFQVPIQFNETATIIDWMIGTQQRAPVDWRILPRTEDDVETAKVKTDVLKYISDVNESQHVRNKAFAQTVKAGVSYTEVCIQRVSSEEPFHHQHVDWRSVLPDSSNKHDDLSKGRYVFRWKWVDLDLALKMFPSRAGLIYRSAYKRTEADFSDVDDEDIPTGIVGVNDLDSKPLFGDVSKQINSQDILGSGTRTRVKLIECQYYDYERTTIVEEGPLKGAIYEKTDTALGEHLAKNNWGLVDKLEKRVHKIIFTEQGLISCGRSPDRHNRFSINALYSYRDDKTGLPYSPIRRWRDVQIDMNKKLAKANHLMQSKQVVMEENAISADQEDLLEDTIHDPNGVFTVKAGKKFELVEGSEFASAHVSMFQLESAFLQRSAGVNDENLGRKTNATSGIAVERRAENGNVVSTQLFNNVGYLVRLEGKTMLSLIEQYMTEKRVFRLTEGVKKKLKWLNVNEPVLGPNNETQYMNDITASMADFIVDEQDFSKTTRASMMESIAKMAQGLEASLALRVFLTALEYSDLPNKDEMVKELRQAAGIKGPDEEMTPEEKSQADQQMAMQAQIADAQAKAAMMATEKIAAEVREINAKAQEIEQRIQGSGGNESQMQDVLSIRQQANQEIETLREELRKAQADLNNKRMDIDATKDIEMEKARIESDTRERVAIIETSAQERIAKLNKGLDGIMTNNQVMAG